MTNGRLYGNWQTGYGYSPDRSRDISHDSLASQFLNASGSRQTGYYYSATPTYSKPKTNGRYLGNGQYVED